MAVEMFHYNCLNNKIAFFFKVSKFKFNFSFYCIEHDCKFGINCPSTFKSACILHLQRKNITPPPHNPSLFNQVCCLPFFRFERVDVYHKFNLTANSAHRYVYVSKIRTMLHCK